MHVLLLLIQVAYSSRSLMQLCTTRHPYNRVLHPVRVPDSIRTATLRAAYDSPGVTRLRRVCSWHRTQCGGVKRSRRDWPAATR